MLSLTDHRKQEWVVIEQVYPFLWLDEVLFRELNPLRQDCVSYEVEELHKLEERFNDELWTVFNALKARTFGLMPTGDIQILAGHFLDAAEALAQQARINLANYREDDQGIIETTEYILASLRDFDGAVRERFHKYLADKKVGNATNNANKMLFKVLCKLSVDQIGIVLKACDDTKLILAKSLSIVFQAIVPFLSTDRMKHISWGSMRKSTYQFSRSDLEFVIAVLEQLIEKIREYF